MERNTLQVEGNMSTKVYRQERIGEISNIENRMQEENVLKNIGSVLQTMEGFREQVELLFYK